MRKKQEKPQQIKRHKTYSSRAMENAYRSCTNNGLPVKRAARIFNVPVTSLRDRVLGKVDHETAIHGKVPLFNKEEEMKLCDHFKTMARFGYGYSRSECVEIASDFAVQLGKRDKSEPLTMKWIRRFLKRWPELRVLKPRGLALVRAKMASEETVSNYFENLAQTINQNNLHDKPHLIFNVDEKGITVNHKPPCVVASESYCPQAVTSGRGKTITILGGGSASGTAIPPFFVFPGKRMNAELMVGKSPGASGTMSETGWSNSAVFREYIISHFLKYVPGRDGQKVLLLLDGHRSHVAIGLAEWAKEHDIILFVLPAHTSHILQPLDVACYGPFERMYNAECHKLMRRTEAIITKYNVCEVACKVYTKALSAENLQSGFKRSGIFPLSKEAIPTEYLITAEVYKGGAGDSEDSDVTVEGGIVAGEMNVGNVVDVKDDNDVLRSRETQLRKVKGEKSKKCRDTISRIVSGKELNECVIEQMKCHETGQKKPTKTDKSKKLTKQVDRKRKSRCNSRVHETKPKPGPSHINLMQDSDLSSDFDSDSAEEKCCVCGKFTPEDVSKSVSLIFVKWAQCDGVSNGHPCMHWVHLTYCSSTRVLRKGDRFLCPHCKNEE